MVIKSVVDNLLYGSIMVLVVGGLCFADCPDEIQDVRRTSFPVIAEINPGENVMLPLTLRVCTKKIGERFKRFSASPRDRYEKKLVKILSSISSKNREKLMEMAVHEQKDGRVLMDSDFIKLGINLKIKLHADHVDRETTKIIERINFGDQVLFIVSFMNSDSSERVVDLFVFKEFENKVYWHGKPTSTLTMLFKRFYSERFSDQLSIKQIKSYQKRKYAFSKVIHTGRQKQNSVMMNFDGRALNYKRVQKNTNDGTNSDPISFYRETMQIYFDQKLSRYKKRLTAGARETFIKEKKEFGREFIKKGIQEQRSKERFLVFVIEADPVYFLFSSVGDRKDISYQDISVSAVVKHEQNEFRLSDLSYESYFVKYLKSKSFYTNVLKPILKKQD